MRSDSSDPLTVHGGVAAVPWTLAQFWRNLNRGIAKNSKAELIATTATSKTHSAHWAWVVSKYIMDSFDRFSYQLTLNWEMASPAKN